MNKKAQTTIFIILGIVVLAAVFIITTLARHVTEKEIEIELKPTEKIPVELNPIKEHIEKCIAQTASEGLSILEEHGGYIDTDRFFINPIDSTEGNAVEYSPKSGYKIPYWYHMKSGNMVSTLTDNDYASEMPNLCRSKRADCITYGDNSIEEHLDEYINSNLKSCINFEAFKEQGFDIKELKEAKATSYIKDGGIVTVYVKYQLEVKKQDTSTKISEFYAEMPSSLYELYKMAYDITDYEATNCFVETHVINVLSLYQGLDEKDLPPTIMNTFGSKGRTLWNMQEVKGSVTQKTGLAIRLLAVFNTLDFRWPYDECYYPGLDCDLPENQVCCMKQGIYNQMVYYPFDEFHNVSVNLFYFDWWNQYFDIQPSKGGLLGPAIIDATGGGWLTAIISSISPRTYEFYYQYSFPVVVELRKKNELGKQELFRFALESNIRANKCLRGEAIISSNTQSATRSLLCDPAIATQDITVTVTDETDSSKKLDNVEVFYYAGDTCLLGYTNKSGVLTSKIAPAYGAFINLGKEGYLNKYVHQGDFSLPHISTNMKPLIEKNVSLRIIDSAAFELIKKAKSCSEAKMLRKENSRPAAEDETIVIQLESIPSSYQDEKIEHLLFFDKNELEPKTVNLVPGKYKIDMQLLLNKDITLPKELDRFCVTDPDPGELGTCEKKPRAGRECLEGCPYCSSDESLLKCTRDCEEWLKYHGTCHIEGYDCDSDSAWGLDCVEGTNEEDMIMPEQKIGIIPNGGAILNGSGQLVWTITDYDQLFNTENITFYIFKHDIPARQADLFDLIKYEEYSEEYPNIIKPEPAGGFC